MTPDKEKYYEQATKKLLKTIDSMGLDKFDRLRAKNLTLLFRDSFKLPDVKYKTFWNELGDNLNALIYDSDGFCRVSSINFAILMKNIKDWQLMYIDDLWTYGPHHYLMHMPSKTVLDLTYDQYTNFGIQIPYELGRKIQHNLVKNDNAYGFANALGIDLISELKKQKD